MQELSGVERLLALEEIKLLKARRDRATDTKDWVTYEALHAPDHHSYNDDYPPWTTAKEMIANISKIMEHLTTVHQSHTPEITFTSPTRADGVWAMHGMSFWRQGEEDHWFEGFGHYFETYEKRDGRWVFTSRRLKYIHTRTSPGGIFPPPPPTPDRA
jgi:SnoaL-like domain